MTPSYCLTAQRAWPKAPVLKGPGVLSPLLYQMRLTLTRSWSHLLRTLSSAIGHTGMRRTWLSVSPGICASSMVKTGKASMGLGYSGKETMNQSARMPGDCFRKLPSPMASGMPAYGGLQMKNARTQT